MSGAFGVTVGPAGDEGTLVVHCMLEVGIEQLAFNVTSVLGHTSVWLAVNIELGRGFTIKLQVTAGPGQVTELTVTEGITERIPMLLIVVEAFKPVNEAMLPIPAAPRPIVVLLLVQLNVVPATGLVKLMALNISFAQTGAGHVNTAVGVGTTVMT